MNLKSDNTGTVTIKEANGISMSGNIKADGSSDKLTGKDKDGNDIEGLIMANGTILRKTIDSTNVDKDTTKEVRIETATGIVRQESSKDFLMGNNDVIYDVKSDPSKQTENIKVTYSKGKEIKNSTGEVVINIKTIVCFMNHQTNQSTMKITEMDGTTFATTTPQNFNNTNDTVLEATDSQGNKKVLEVSHKNNTLTLTGYDNKGVKTSTEKKASFDLNSLINLDSLDEEVQSQIK